MSSLKVQLLKESRKVVEYSTFVEALRDILSKESMEYDGVQRNSENITKIIDGKMAYNGNIISGYKVVERTITFETMNKYSLTCLLVNNLERFEQKQKTSKEVSDKIDKMKKLAELVVDNESLYLQLQQQIADLQVKTQKVNLANEFIKLLQEILKDENCLKAIKSKNTDKIRKQFIENNKEEK